MSLIHSHSAILEDGSAVLYHLIEGTDGELITIPALASITFKVFLDASGVQVGLTGTVNINTSVFNEVQTHTDDPRFPEFGSIAPGGFNFRHKLDATYFPDGTDPPTIYRVEYYAVSSVALGSEAFAWANRIPVLGLHGS